jgi:hypothetical protein
MSAAANKQLMQQIFAELSKGNSRPFVESMDDNFRWIMTGNTKWSKSYDGKQVVLSELFRHCVRSSPTKSERRHTASLPRTIWSWSKLGAATPKRESLQQHVLLRRSPCRRQAAELTEYLDTGW